MDFTLVRVPDCKVRQFFADQNSGIRSMLLVMASSLG